MALRQEGYWDEHYRNELINFESDGDEGEIWFGKALTRKIARWIITRVQESKLQQVPRVVDIGCGNVILLCTIHELLAESLGEGCEIPVNMLGLDYSANSIELGRKILESKQLANAIQIEECDLLDIDNVRAATKGLEYDFIIDKGTYDAICLLASSTNEDLKAAKTKYTQSLAAMVRDGSVLILASCNHTEHELIALLRGQDDSGSIGIGRQFNIIDKIETPKIQFGGQEGSQVCCLIVQFGPC